MAKGIVIGGLNGAQSNIKSIQRGVTSLSSPNSIDVAINSVNANKSILLFYYKSGTSSSINATEVAVRGVLSNNKITFNTTGNSSYIKSIYWQVIEFNDVKSKQSGNFTATRNTAEESITIGKIDINKSFIVASNTAVGGEYAAGKLNTASRIKDETTISIYSSTTGDITNWQVIEFY